jgi:NAD(P)-dependent dehydrogenase (short-subunit alcohol dehydrogenase family)
VTGTRKLCVVLRAELLNGRTIALAGAPVGLSAALQALGATVAADGARPDTIVADARAAFLTAGAGYEGVRAGVDGAFTAVRDVATDHWIDGPGTGQVVLVAPVEGAGRHAGAARAGLENLARTLSTEWARHGVSTVALLPGPATTEAALADLVGWLASPAGAYVSGTALTVDRAL